MMFINYTACILRQQWHAVCEKSTNYCFIISDLDISPYLIERHTQRSFLVLNLAFCLCEHAKIDLFQVYCQPYGPGSSEEL